MMILIPNGSGYIHYLAGKYENKIGTLISPKSYRPPKHWMPYACDNDAFIAWKNKTEWDERGWLEFLKKLKKSHVKPLWVLVPDVVANKDETLTRWYKYSTIVFDYGFKTAFAMQDEMLTSDVPSSADVVFIGGSTYWKWKNMPTISNSFKRVHVGRVNTTKRLIACRDNGVESVDGTGFMRESHCGSRIKIVSDFLENKERQIELFNEKPKPKY